MTFFYHSAGNFGPQILEINRVRTQRLLDDLNKAKQQYEMACQAAEASPDFDFEKKERAELVAIDLYDRLNRQVSDFLCYSLRLREDVAVLRATNRLLRLLVERFTIKERPLWTLIKPAFNPELVSRMQQSRDQS